MKYQEEFISKPSQDRCLRTVKLSNTKLEDKEKVKNNCKIKTRSQIHYDLIVVFLNGSEF